MKVSVDQALLSKTIKRAMLSSGVSPNVAHSLVKIEAKKAASKTDVDVLSLTSTAGIMSINLQMTAQVLDPGVIAVNTRELGNYATSMPSGAVSLSTTERRLKVSGGSRNGNVTLADPSLIQPTPEPTKAHWVRVPVEALEAALARVSFATSDYTSQAPAVCDGVRLIGEAQSLTSVVCTGYLCIAYEQAVKLELKKESPRWEATLVTRALPAIGDIIAEAKAEEKKTIDLYADDFFVYVIGHSTLFVASIPTGEYPAWRNLLDSYPKSRICVVPRLALIESIKGAKATSTGVTDKIGAGADFHVSGPNIIVKREDSDNDFEEQIPLAEIEPNTDAKFRCALSYMQDALSHASENPALTPHPGGTMIMAHEGGYRASMCLMTPREAAPKAEDKKK